MTIDLNSDLGEGFGIWPLGDDEALLALVTSANVACGFHAGDPRILLQTCRWAVAQGVAIGAQVAYRDLAGFGRRFIDVRPGGPDRRHRSTRSARCEGLRAGRGRPGLLRQAARRALQRDRAPRGAGRRGGRRRSASYDPGLPVLGLPGLGGGCALAEAAGLTTVAEAFADRAYTPEGTLVPRGAAGRGAARRRPRWPTGLPADGAWTSQVEAVDGTPSSSRPPRSACTATPRARSSMAGRSATTLAAAGVTPGPVRRRRADEHTG